MTTIAGLEAHGIPVTALAAAGLAETKTVVHDVGQLRSLLDQGLDQQGRQAHHDALFNGIQPAATGGAAADDAGGAALSQRIAAHVVGNANLSDEDHAAIAPAFPLTAHVTAATGPLTVRSRYDLSTPDGSMRIASFTDVTLEQGGYFVCESTPLTFTCATLTRNGTSGSSGADFSILGKTGATPPTPPAPAGSGQAAAGPPGLCYAAGVAGPGGGNGSAGAPGAPGTAGVTGGPGTPSMPATINIQTALTVTGPLTVYSQSGPGGQGGNGGAGGPGQQGGNGGNGVSCDCTGNGGGQGGPGGRGGDGGAAGNGGNAVNAAGNVVIRVPGQADVAKVHFTTAVAPPGAVGQPGPGGPGGAGGSGGSGGKDSPGGGPGGSSGPGATGAPGQPGTVSGRAAQITVTPA
jgi:hypothetical protein